MCVCTDHPQSGRRIEYLGGSDSHGKKGCRSQERDYGCFQAVRPVISANIASHQAGFISGRMFISISRELYAERRILSAHAEDRGCPAPFVLRQKSDAQVVAWSLVGRSAAPTPHHTTQGVRVLCVLFLRWPRGLLATRAGTVSLFRKDDALYAGGGLRCVASVDVAGGPGQGCAQRLRG